MPRLPARNRAPQGHHCPPVLPVWRAAAGAALLMAMGVTATTSAQAAPAERFVPTDPSAVVQRVPASPDAQARRQRAQLAQSPQNLPLALATARQAIERARTLGDPRELGLAQAALAPWWAQAAPPPAARLMRAIVLQGQHHFEPALADLRALVDGGDVPLAVRAQAALTRVSLLQVTGQLPAAAAACAQLADATYAELGDALSLPARACAAEIDSLRGGRERAAKALGQLTRAHPDDPWLALLQAELAQRRGDAATAEAAFARAVAAQPDVYTLAAQADWLLDQHRPGAVLRLLAAHPSEADALRLRQAIALNLLGRRGDAQAARQATELARTLSERFEAARRRGSVPHAREEARLALDVMDQPAQALSLAQQNWQHQREPADAVLLWRSALAAGQTDAARKALTDWAADPVATDVRLGASAAAGGAGA